MPKPSFGDVAASILDPMLSDNFLLNIPNLPMPGGFENALRMQCQSATKPGFTINAVEVQLFGHTIEYAGNLSYGHDLSVEYIENSSAQITQTLENWGKLIRSDETQTGAFKREYARDGILSIFDQKGNVVKAYRIENMWPGTIPDLAFNGSNSSSLTLSASFKYDRVLLVS